MKKIDWVEYFLDIADSVAQRASCYRAKVGCVIVKDKRIISTGYNGSPRGRKDCFDRGECYREIVGIKSGTELDRCYSSGAHAEMNAIINAARYGASVLDGELYLVGHNFLCQSCQAAVLNAGIRIVYLRDRSGVVYTIDPQKEFHLHALDEYDEELDWPRRNWML